MKKSSSKLEFVKVCDSDVRHIWRDEEGNEVVVSPDFYQESGTPVSEDGNDMEYVRTEVRVCKEK